MRNPILKTSLTLFATIGLATSVQAGLILNTYSSGVTPDIIGGYAMTDVGVITDSNLLGTSINSINSPITGTIGLEDTNGSVNLGLVDSTSWWANSESHDFNTFTTGTSTIEILMPANTFAFSFNIGANANVHGWFDVYDESGNLSNLGRTNFAFNTPNSPGYGIYADNSNGSCSSISKIVVDPTFAWGIGNLSINQGSCSNEVPEPSSIALFALGLIGLGVIRNKRTH